jgi:hypothetical protein
MAAGKVVFKRFIDLPGSAVKPQADKMIIAIVTPAANGTINNVSTPGITGARAGDAVFVTPLTAAATGTGAVVGGIRGSVSANDTVDVDWTTASAVVADTDKWAIMVVSQIPL